ncbi:DUF2799 domain-containing protein [Escherichia coli]
MMKKFIAPLLALLVSGCQIDPYTHAPTLTSTDWYDVGMEDAISGSAIKDDDAFSDSQADRGLYMPKDKRKLARPILLMPEDFPVKAFLPAATMLKMPANCMKYGKKGLMKMPAQYD